MRSTRSAAFLACSLVLAAAIVPAGCSSGSSASAGSSVVTAHPAAADQLDFFDALEARPSVTYDDAIHAALLLEQEDSQLDFNRRVAVARQNGLLHGDFDRPATAPISTGDAADLVMRAMVSRAGTGRAAESTPAGATAQFQAAGVLPEAAKATDRISGHDFVAMVTGAREIIGLAPAREPTVLAEAPAAPPAPAGGESFDEPVAPARAAAESGATRELTALPPPAPTNEPLLPPGAAPAPTSTPAAGRPEPTPIPTAPAPTPAAAAPTKPKPQPKPEPVQREPAKDKRWVPGKPVKPPAPPAPAPPASGG
jgi:hypothetical protein